MARFVLLITHIQIQKQMVGMGAVSGYFLVKSTACIYIYIYIFFYIKNAGLYGCIMPTGREPAFAQALI